MKHKPTYQVDPRAIELEELEHELANHRGFHAEGSRPQSTGSTLSKGPIIWGPPPILQPPKVLSTIEKGPPITFVDGTPIVLVNQPKPKAGLFPIFPKTTTAKARRVRSTIRYQQRIPNLPPGIRGITSATGPTYWASISLYSHKYNSDRTKSLEKALRFLQELLSSLGLTKVPDRHDPRPFDSYSSWSRSKRKGIYSTSSGSQTKYYGTVYYKRKVHNTCIFDTPEEAEKARHELIELLGSQ